MDKIPNLNDYNDWLLKAKHDYEKFNSTLNPHIYDLVNCILTLNALPEWIQRSDSAPEILKNLAEEKEQIMKGRNRFDFEIDLLYSDIDHQLMIYKDVFKSLKAWGKNSNTYYF